MKKKAFSKTLLSAVLTIALALSMIGGATYALFTSSSNTNVAITSATVQVTATPKNLKVYSPTLINMDGTIADKNNAVDENASTFVGGGTATMEGSTLTLKNIAPGDKVSFDIDYANESNIAAKYRFSIIGKGLTTKNADGSDRHGTALLAALKITFSENGGTEKTYDHIKNYFSVWKKLPADTKELSTWSVTVELPANCGNEYQNRACQIAFQISAVQSNTNIHEPEITATEEKPHVEYINAIFTGAELREAVSGINSGESTSLVFGENISTAALSQKLNSKGQLVGNLYIDNKDVSIDLDGYSLNITNAYGQCAIIKNNSKLSIKNGTVTATRSNSYKPMFFVGGDSSTGSAPNVDTLELDNVTVGYKIDTNIDAVNNGWSTVISSNASNQYATSNVTVNDTTINIDGPVLAPVYLPNKGTRNFNNCTITGSRVATSIFICGGDWNIKGGSYVGNKYELGGDLSAENASIQDQIIAQDDYRWEHKASFGGTEYGNGILGYRNGGWGTGDAICIMNRDTENYQLGNINIDGTKFVIGDVALTGENLTNAAVGTPISGPSGYGVRIYDVKTNIGAISIKNISVTSSKQVIKGETTNTEKVLEYINVITAGGGIEDRAYASCNEFEAPARGTAAN